jgi:hypothetical protein
MVVPIYSRNLTVQSYIVLLPHFVYSPISLVNPSLPPDIINIDDTCLQEMEHSLDADKEDFYHNSTDNLTE